jgi:carbon storage regulator
MLVLTRRVGETIVIDGNIEVTVVAIQGDKVRLGVNAPRSMRVDRQEVHERRAAFDLPAERLEADLVVAAKAGRNPR